ncbi:MAG: LysR family transcriptional regulator [Roseibacillus sp.]|nr:LysR family transcriptional regulator [Roseibacillus sp.]
MFDELFKRGGLSLERLHSFLAVVDAGSIAAAADRNLNRQSLISRQIRELEEFFGTELTTRRGKSIAVTPEGRRLGELVRMNLLGMQDFLLDARARPRTITIGAGGSALEWLVGPAARSIQSALGDVTVRLEVNRTAQLVEKVRDGRLDFAVLRSDAIPRGSPSKPITEVGFVLCVPKAMDRPKLLVPDLLRGLPLALPVPGGKFREILHDYFNDHDIPWKAQVESSSFLQAFALVKGGNFAAVLPTTGAAQLPQGQFRIRKISALREQGRKLVLHWNERQMETRGIAPAAITKVRDAVRGG